MPRPDNSPTSGYILEYPLLRVDDFRSPKSGILLPTKLQEWARQLERRRATDLAGRNVSVSQQAQVSSTQHQVFFPTSRVDDSAFGPSGSFGLDQNGFIDCGDLQEGQTHFEEASVYLLTHIVSSTEPLFDLRD